MVQLKTTDTEADALAGAQRRFATITKDEPNLILSCAKDILFRRKLEKLTALEIIIAR